VDLGRLVAQRRISSLRCAAVRRPGCSGDVSRRGARSRVPLSGAPGPRGAGESQAWRRPVTIIGMPMTKRTPRDRGLSFGRGLIAREGVPVRLCVLQKSTDDAWLREAKNRSLLTEHRFAQTEPSKEQRFRFATSNRERVLRAKTRREAHRGGKVAVTPKGWSSRADGRKRPPARHEGAVILRRKASRAVDTALLSRRARSKRSRRSSMFTVRARARRPKRAARQGCQRLGPKAHSGKTKPRSVDSSGPAEAVCGVVKRRISPYERTAKALRRVGNPRGAGARSRECWEAEVGQTHRASRSVDRRKTG